MALGELQEASIPLWQPRPPVVSLAAVKNSGNIGLDVAVNTTVESVLGATKHAETRQYNLYPKSERVIGSSWEQVPNFGLYKVVQTIAFLDQKHASSGYVIVAPRWFPIAIILTVVAGGAYAVFRNRKNYR